MYVSLILLQIFETSTTNWIADSLQLMYRERAAGIKLLWRGQENSALTVTKPSGWAENEPPPLIFLISETSWKLTDSMTNLNMIKPKLNLLICTRTHNLILQIGLGFGLVGPQAKIHFTTFLEELISADHNTAGFNFFF